MPSEMCDQFANFFKIIYVTDDISPFRVDSNGFNSNLNFCDLLLSSNCVLEALRNVDENKVCGSDNIPLVFLKRCAKKMVIPLQNIFNTSLKAGIFPRKFIFSSNFKSGSTNNIENYRGISLSDN